jgi:hypothetical protein
MVVEFRRGAWQIVVEASLTTQAVPREMNVGDEQEDTSLVPQ